MAGNKTSGRCFIEKKYLIIASNYNAAGKKARNENRESRNIFRLKFLVYQL